jgi:hypothetical protein
MGKAKSGPLNMRFEELLKQLNHVLAFVWGQMDLVKGDVWHTLPGAFQLRIDQWESRPRSVDVMVLILQEAGLMRHRRHADVIEWQVIEEGYSTEYLSEAWVMRAQSQVKNKHDLMAKHQRTMAELATARGEISNLEAQLAVRPRVTPAGADNEGEVIDQVAATIVELERLSDELKALKLEAAANESEKNRLADLVALLRAKQEASLTLAQSIEKAREKALKR